MSKRGKTIKYVSLTAFVFLMFVLQGMIFPHLEIYGIKPLILPAAVVAIAIHEGCENGTLFGLIGGVFCDLTFNQPTVAFTVLLTAIGTVVGILSEGFLRKNYITFLVCSFGALLLSAAVQMFSLLVYKHMAFVSLAETALLQTVYSLILALPVYYLAGVICRVNGKN